MGRMCAGTVLFVPSALFGPVRIVADPKHHTEIVRKASPAKAHPSRDGGSEDLSPAQEQPLASSHPQRLTEQMREEEAEDRIAPAIVCQEPRGQCVQPAAGPRSVTLDHLEVVVLAPAYPMNYIDQFLDGKHRPNKRHGVARLQRIVTGCGVSQAPDENQ
mmetsp:Transcript_15503/g.23668  ORF Transcript_15503/g.23668 Transcript_15503/m.23668 type:complete len:160 (-) Transcript_15503:185-664(-)